MTITVGSRRFRMADLGSPSSLPMVGAPLESPYRIAGDLPGEIIAGSGYGNPDNLYPYVEQDGYGREPTDRRLTTVVLENDRLRAVFLPELGGRMWELYDRRAGVHLLHSPPSIQFANLALRNAWFAGGIEWNIGTRGHSPTTCDPLHTAVVTRPDGTEVLRMWEFDRLREVVFQVDAWLPDGSDVLFTAIRIRNPGADPVPMYWWTNAAIPQSVDTRVIAPAESAFASSYDGGISRVDPTDDGGIDCTWPFLSPRARDFFFDIPVDSPRWIVAADGAGDGLAMVSTAELRGRKLFVWGEGRGGERWQDWLTPDGTRYAEIQAGLAQTQFQHLELPAASEWSWVEAYGNGRLDPVARAADWSTAVQSAAERMTELVSPQALAVAQATALAGFDLAPARILFRGSGWGALESARRDGTGWIDETGTPFGAVDDEQRPWLDLLRGGGFAGASSFVRGADWAAALEAEGDGAATLLHRAVISHADGRADEARALYSASLTFEPTALAHRGLAVLDSGSGSALDHYGAALALSPDESLLVEAATAAVAAGDGAAALRYLASRSIPGPRAGRLRLIEAEAHLLRGSVELAADILRSGLVVADLREGENPLAALWGRVFPGVAVPAEYDFSMNLTLEE